MSGAASKPFAKELEVNMPYLDDDEIIDAVMPVFSIGAPFLSRKVANAIQALFDKRVELDKVIDSKLFEPKPFLVNDLGVCPWCNNGLENIYHPVRGVACSQHCLDQLARYVFAEDAGLANPARFEHNGIVFKRADFEDWNEYASAVACYVRDNGLL